MVRALHLVFSATEEEVQACLYRSDRESAKLLGPPRRGGGVRLSHRTTRGSEQDQPCDSLSLAGGAVSLL